MYHSVTERGNKGGNSCCPVTETAGRVLFSDHVKNVGHIFFLAKMCEKVLQFTDHCVKIWDGDHLVMVKI